MKPIIEVLILSTGGILFQIFGPCTFNNFRPYLEVLAVGINKVLVNVKFCMSINLDLVLCLCI